MNNNNENTAILIFKMAMIYKVINHVQIIDVLIECICLSSIL